MDAEPRTVFRWLAIVVALFAAAALIGPLWFLTVPFAFAFAGWKVIEVRDTLSDAELEAWLHG